MRAGDDHRRHRRAGGARPGAGHRAGPEPLEHARAHAAGVAGVEFALGDVYALDEPDATFDVVHAHQVLQHLADPVAALREMLRVCRPDGVVGARDADYAAMTWYPADPLLDRWLAIYRAVARGNGAEPDAGRRLLAWARAAGAADVVPTASVWCYATPADRQWWGGMWADRILESAITGQAVGRRPRRPRRAGRHLRGLAALGGRRRRLVRDPARRGGVPPGALNRSYAEPVLR